MLGGGGGGESRGGFQFGYWVTVLSALQLLTLSYQTASVYPIKVSDKLFLSLIGVCGYPCGRGLNFPKEKVYLG